MKRELAGLGWLLIAALPLLLVLGLQVMSARQLALALAAIAGLRLFLVRGDDGILPWLLPAALVVLALAAAGSGNSDCLRYYPLLVNGALLTLFATSLWRGPPVVERLARLREPNLPPAAVHYTRRVTGVWCLFFLGNGAAALYTALFSSLETWALYNGFVAYLLMGALFTAEWLLRQRVRRAHRA